jgi:hypothetical protein
MHSAVGVLAALAAVLTFTNTSLAVAAGIASFLLAWNGPKLLQYFSSLGVNESDSVSIPD